MKPTWQSGDGSIRLYRGDANEILPRLKDEAISVTITDPPYGVTDLAWDKTVPNWPNLLASNSLWCFGSLRFFIENGKRDFAGWKLAQEIVWEKANGSNMHNDRFRRVHELAVQYYRGKWRDVYKQAVLVADPKQRVRVSRGRQIAHFGAMKQQTYTRTLPNGFRLERSIIKVPNCRGYAIHPTQKPLGILTPLVEYSAPPAGLVLDPFFGSGSTAEACVASGRHFIGIERDRDYFDKAVARLKAVLAQ